MKKNFKKALSMVLSASMALSMGSGISLGANTGVAGAAQSGDAASGSAIKGYTAAVSFQTSNYDCRDSFGGYVERDGDGSKDTAVAMFKYRDEMKKEDSEASNYNNLDMFYRGQVPSMNTKMELKNLDLKDDNDEFVRDEAGNKVKVHAEPIIGATVQDAKVTEDGEYTISISGLDLTQNRHKVGVEPEKKAFTMLSVATDIPVSQTTVKVSNATLKIDGKEIGTFAVLPNKADGKTFQDFMIANVYATADGKGDGTKDVPYPANPDKTKETPLLPKTLLTVLPSQSIEISFKIENVDYKDAPTVDPVTALRQKYDANKGTETTAPEETTAPVPTTTPVAKEPISKSFDIYLATNVNKAFNPEVENNMGSDGKAIQAAIYASASLEAKIKALMSPTNPSKTLYDFGTMNFRTNENASLTINETGDYSLSATAEDDAEDLKDSGAIWMPLIIDSMPTDFNLKGTSITVGEGADAKTYAWNAQIYQDANKSIRLSVCNQWATAAENEIANPFKNSKDMIEVKKGDKITFNFQVAKGAPAPVKTATPGAIDNTPKKAYDAYLGFQTDTYVFRNTWNDENYGLNSKEIDYKTEVGSWDNDKLVKNKVTFTDASMTDNTTYTVAVDGLNLQAIKGSKATDQVSKQFNMLFVSTTIPLSMKGVKMTKATLKIDGNVVKEYTVAPCKGDAVGYYQFMLANAYGPGDGTVDCPYPDGDTLKVMPTSKIEVSYTLSGVDFDRHVLGKAKGKTFTSGNYKYKVTKECVKSATAPAIAGTVKVVGLSKKGLKKASLSLGASTKIVSKGAIDGSADATYKITSIKSGAFSKSKKLKSVSLKKATNIKTISSGAFAKCKKLAKVELGKKTTKISAKAFQNDKKLKALKLNAKLKKVSKNAFKGCKKKIKVSGKAKKANIKKLKKSGYKKFK